MSGDDAGQAARIRFPGGWCGSGCGDQVSGRTMRIRLRGSGFLWDDADQAVGDQSSGE